jgi:ABC-type uncharacterized transport system substrate-binding protein
MYDTLRWSALGGAVFALALGAPVTALAHPHVFVDAKAEIVFDSQGRMTAVRNIWRFDPAFSAYASQGLDKNGDGRLSDEELAPLAETNVTSLKDFGFFTRLSVDGRELKLKFPDRYFLRASGDQLTLYYQLPLEAPARVGAKTVLEVYDPEYFVAFAFVKKDPITLEHAPAGCRAEYHPPRPLDASVMMRLSQVPASQRDLPPALRDAAVGLANLITVECPP